jgi:2-iminobutanoate/2-iminopropanoate deaminase
MRDQRFGRRAVLTLSAVILASLSGFILGANAQSKPQDHKHIDVALLPGAPPRPFSNAVMAGDTLYLSGTVGNDPKTGVPPPVFADAVRQAIANQTMALKEAGLTWADVVKVNVYVKDMGKYAEFNGIYMKEIPAPYPARTFIAVADLPANGQVEIEGIAVRRK